MGIFPHVITDEALPARMERQGQLPFRVVVPLEGDRLGQAAVQEGQGGQGRPGKMLAEGSHRADPGEGMPE